MRNILKGFILFFLFTFNLWASQMNIKNLRCEDKINPLGVDIENPRFSWNLESDQRGVKQTAYQVFVATDLEDLNSYKTDVWNSGKVLSDKSTA